MKKQTQPSPMRCSCFSTFVLLFTLTLLFTALHLYLLLQQHVHRSQGTEAVFFLKRFVQLQSPIVEPETNKIELSTKINNIEALRERESMMKPFQSSYDVPTKEKVSMSVVDFGAVGNNITDNTAAIHATIAAVTRLGGGEVVVPEGGVFQTGPFNLTSNMVLRVEGVLVGIPDRDKFPVVTILPTYPRDCDLTTKKARFHPLVNAVNQHNVTIRGNGTIDGGGWYWYPCLKNHTHCNDFGRPHLMELQSCTTVEITEVTLKDSAFWTLHPVYCTNVHIHHMRIEAPYCPHYDCPNTDGIDVDSCQNVLIEHNTITVGDDHVTVIAGRKRIGHRKVCKNVTVRHNTLLNGMGLSIGSGTSGGVENVLFHDNVMTETVGHRGQGLHIKTRTRFGGYVKNVAWIDNVFHVAGKPGGAISIEQGYQSGGATCDPNKCTDISNVVIRNLTVHKGNPGAIKCFENKPCVNITLDSVRFLDPPKGQRIVCTNVLSGSASNTFPEDILDGCPGISRFEARGNWDYARMILK